MEDAHFEFNSFLLQISKELTQNELQQLKFVLKGSATSARCDEMTEAFLYFGELQKLLLLTPTRFQVLTKALNVIGRSDLAEKLEGKKEQFAVLFKPQLKDGDTLEQKGLYPASVLRALRREISWYIIQSGYGGRGDCQVYHSALVGGKPYTPIRIRPGLPSSK